MIGRSNPDPGPARLVCQGDGACSQFCRRQRWCEPRPPTMIALDRRIGSFRPRFVLEKISHDAQPQRQGDVVRKGGLGKESSDSALGASRSVQLACVVNLFGRFRDRILRSAGRFIRRARPHLCWKPGRVQLAIISSSDSPPFAMFAHSRE